MISRETRHENGTTTVNKNIPQGCELREFTIRHNEKVWRSYMLVRADTGLLVSTLLFDEHGKFMYTKKEMRTLVKRATREFEESRKKYGKYDR
jgi:hypothetical protein